MSFDLAYPLGGEEQENFLRFERIIMTIVPPWLRRTIGGAILQGIARVMDALIYRAGYGVRLRFPFVDEDSLSLAGRERRMTRGPTETSLTYSGRVQGWLPAHQHRGSAWELLRQWRAYNGQDAYDANAGQPIDVLYQSGTLYKLYQSGTLERAIVGWGGPLPAGGWAQAWCFLYVDADPGALTDAQKAELLLIPRQWNAAHMLPLNVVVVWPGAALWAYPDDGLTWTEDAALYTWDDVPHTVI